MQKAASLLQFTQLDEGACVAMDSRGRQARDRDRICVMLERMPRISPTLEGFRAVFRRPSFTLAEITWRWTAGATTVVLLLFGLVEFLGTLPVTDRELLFLRTRHPYLVIQALAHILHGSVSRAVISLMLAVLLLTLVWIVAASFGRYVTVSALLDYFRDAAAGANRGEGDVVGNVSRTAMASREGAPVRVLVRLNFLRAAVTLAALASFAGAAILAGFASADGRPRPGLALLVFLILAALICMAWNSLNWMLSLAGIFAVRDHDDALTAISTAASFSGDRAAAIFSVSTWTGLVHLAAFIGATAVVSIPLGFVAFVQWRLVVAIVLIFTLAYFAIADWIYMARLAGYVCIAEMPEGLGTTPPVVSPVVLDTSLQTTMDRDEPILSDVPLRFATP